MIDTGYGESHLTLIEHRTTSLIAGFLFGIAALAIIAQLRSLSPIVEGGPLEIADAVFGAAIALCVSAITGLVWQRNGRLPFVWALLTIASWAWVAADLVGPDSAFFPIIVQDDVGSLLAWAITATAILPVLYCRRYPAMSRLLLGVGFVLQSIAFAADLGDGSIFHLPDLSSLATTAAGESFEVLYLAAYVAGLLTIALSLRAVPASENAPVLWTLMRSSPGRLVTVWVEGISWKIWRFQHPGAPFSAYYADIIGRKLDSGRPHRTLGQQLWGKDSLLASKGDRRTTFSSEGIKHFEKIKTFGVGAADTVVDFGCGSLRVGQHFIHHLDPGHYWGLDISDRFFSDGLALLPAGMQDEKNPRLHVINAESLALARAAKPDFIFSTAVMKHVPRDELDEFWKSIAGLMHPGTIAIVGCEIFDKYLRTSAKSWAQSELFVREVIERNLPHVPYKIEFSDRTKRISGRVVRAATIVAGSRQV